MIELPPKVREMMNDHIKVLAEMSLVELSLYFGALFSVMKLRLGFDNARKVVIEGMDAIKPPGSPQ